MRISSPFRSSRRIARRFSGVQLICDSSRIRRSPSSSRTIASRSRAIGRSSRDLGSGDSASDWPRISALMPAIQPRNDSSAITTVISAITAPIAANRYTMYFLVSALRRSMKLMSCTMSNSPMRWLSTMIGLAPTCSALAPRLTTRPASSAGSPAARQTTSGGSVGVR